MKRLLFIFSLLLLSGCARISLDPPGKIASGGLIVKDYELNQSKTVYIGQPIVKWREAKASRQANSVVVVDDFTLSGTYKSKLIFNRDIKISGKKGDVLPVVGMSHGCHIIDISDGDDTYGLFITSEGQLRKDILTNDDHDHYLTSDSATLTPDVVRFNDNSKASYQISSFGMSYELIFGGINDVTINMVYREYSPSDHARQAFFQNLVYRTDADVIRFRDFKIKLYEVTNERIVYTVIEDGMDNK